MPSASSGDRVLSTVERARRVSRRCTSDLRSSASHRSRVSQSAVANASGILDVARHGVDHVGVDAVREHAAVRSGSAAPRVEINRLALLTLGPRDQRVVLEDLQVDEPRGDTERPEHEQGAREGEPRPHREAPVGDRGRIELVVGALRVAYDASVVQRGGAGVERRKKVRRVLARATHRCATTALDGGGVTVTRSMTVDVSCVGGFIPSWRVAMASTRAGPTRNSCSRRDGDGRAQPCLLPARPLPPCRAAARPGAAMRQTAPSPARTRPEHRAHEVALARVIHLAHDGAVLHLLADDELAVQLRPAFRRRAIWRCGRGGCARSRLRKPRWAAA